MVALTDYQKYKCCNNITDDPLITEANCLANGVELCVQDKLTGNINVCGKCDEFMENFCLNTVPQNQQQLDSSGNSEYVKCACFWSPFYKNPPHINQREPTVSAVCADGNCIDKGYKTQTMINANCPQICDEIVNINNTTTYGGINVKQTCKQYMQNSSGSNGSNGGISNSGSNGSNGSSTPIPSKNMNYLLYTLAALFVIVLVIFFIVLL